MFRLVRSLHQLLLCCEKLLTVLCRIITYKSKLYGHSDDRRGEMKENSGILFLAMFFSLANQTIHLKCYLTHSPSPVTLVIREAVEIGKQAEFLEPHRRPGPPQGLPLPDGPAGCPLSVETAVSEEEEEVFVWIFGYFLCGRWGMSVRFGVSPLLSRLWFCGCWHSHTSFYPVPHRAWRPSHFTDWRPVAALRGASRLAPLFQQHLLTPCLCQSGDSHGISDFFISTVFVYNTNCDRWLIIIQWKLRWWLLAILVINLRYVHCFFLRHNAIHI